MPPEAPRDDPRSPFDPRHWGLPSPLVVCWAAMVALAAVAAWWCARLPGAVGIPLLLVVLFAAGIATLVLFVAAARGLVAEMRSRLDAISAAVATADLLRQDIAALRSSLERIRGEGRGATVDLVRKERATLERSLERIRGEGANASADLVRQDLTALHRSLAESISRARSEIEDGKALLVDLIRGPEVLAPLPSDRRTEVVDGE